MTYVAASEAPERNTGLIKLHGAEDFEGMRNAGRLAAEVLDMIIPHVQPGVSTGELVEVQSDFGRIEIPVRITDEMMPRTVAIPQCWGHGKAEGLSHARAHPGVNSNFLAPDGYDSIEPLSGMSHLSGIPIEVRRAAD